MGAPTSQFEDITENIFFNEIDWKKLERRQLDPPFRPQVVSHLLFTFLLTIIMNFDIVSRNIH